MFLNLVLKTQVESTQAIVNVLKKVTLTYKKTIGKYTQKC